MDCLNDILATLSDCKGQRIGKGSGTVFGWACSRNTPEMIPGLLDHADTLLYKI